MSQRDWRDVDSARDAVYGADEEELERRRPRESPGKRTLTSQLARAAVQRKRSQRVPHEPRRVEEVAAGGVQSSGEPLPHLERIQASFGQHDVSDVRAHVGGAAAEASAAIGAEAYATGKDVAFARAPDLHTAAHEAAHTVQQQRGVQLAGGAGREGDAYERQADAAADAVVRGESAAAILGATPSSSVTEPGLQRKPARGGTLPAELQARVDSLSPGARKALESWLNTMPPEMAEDPGSRIHAVEVGVADLELQERIAKQTEEREKMAPEIDARLRARMRQWNDALFGGRGDGAQSADGRSRGRHSGGLGPEGVAPTAPADAPGNDPARADQDAHTHRSSTKTRGPRSHGPVRGRPPAPQPLKLGPSRHFAVSKSGSFRGIEWTLSAGLTAAVILQEGTRNITRLDGDATGPEVWHHLSASEATMGGQIAKAAITAEPVDGLQIDIETELLGFALRLSKDPSLKTTLVKISGTVTGIIPQSWVGGRLHVSIAGSLTLEAGAEIMFRQLRGLLMTMLVARGLLDHWRKLRDLFDDDDEDDGGGDDDDGGDDHRGKDDRGEEVRQTGPGDSEQAEPEAALAARGRQRRHGRIFPFDPKVARDALRYDGTKGEPALAGNPLLLFFNGLRREGAFYVGTANRPFMLANVTMEPERVSAEDAPAEELAFRCWFEVTLLVPLRGHLVPSTERFSVMMYPNAKDADGKEQVNQVEAVDLSALLGVLERRGHHVRVRGTPEVDFGLFRARILSVQIDSTPSEQDGALQLGGHRLTLHVLPVSNAHGYESVSIALEGHTLVLTMGEETRFSLKVPDGISL